VSSHELLNLAVVVYISLIKCLSAVIDDCENMMKAFVKDTVREPLCSACIRKEMLLYLVSCERRKYLQLKSIKVIAKSQN
jgi:hypothetical protein